MNEILIINQQYAPETAATGQVFQALAEELAARGETVSVICGRPFYPGGTARVAEREVIGGVSVRRLWNTTYPKSSVKGKLFNQLTFMLSVLIFALSSIKKNQTALVTTAPPLCVVCLAIARRLRGFDLVLSVQDLYPDILAAAGRLRPNSVIYRLLRRAMAWGMQTCRGVAAISTDMARHLRLFYGLSGVSMIPNPSVNSIRSIPFGMAKAERGWVDKFVVQYSGNFGEAHEYKTLLSVMRKLRDHPGILFHIAGGGAHYELLKKESLEGNDGLPNVVFEGYAELSALDRRLSAADISLVIFDAAFRDVLLPSKYVGILASGRPVLLISGAVSDISRDLRREGAGLHFDHGESDAIANALVELADHPSRVHSMGAKARALYERSYLNDSIFTSYQRLLRGV